MSKITKEQLHSVIETINGTSGIYDESAIENLPIDDLNDIIEELEEEGIFRCDFCGWWCDDLTDNENILDVCCTECEGDVLL